MPQYVPIRYGGDVIDLSKRFAFSTTVAASPSGSSETTIASLSIPSGVEITTGVLLEAWFALTYGTSAASITTKLKRGTTQLVSSGIVTAGVAAAALDERNVAYVDTAATDGATYNLTITIGSGAAASTVSAVYFSAILF